VSYETLYIDRQNRIKAIASATIYQNPEYSNPPAHAKFYTRESVLPL